MLAPLLPTGSLASLQTCSPSLPATGFMSTDTVPYLYTLVTQLEMRFICTSRGKNITGSGRETQNTVEMNYADSESR